MPFIYIAKRIQSVYYQLMNWTHLYKKYAGSWVALKADEKTVITSASTAQEVFKKAKEKGFDKPIITRVPKELLPFAG